MRSLVILIGLLLIVVSIQPQPHRQPIDWHRQAIYFILIDRFHNGDSGNDGEVYRNNPYAYHGGDLQGIYDKLDYLQELGVTVLWLSPVFDNRDDRFFKYWAYHGYWPKDFYNVEERFGDMKLLQKLAQELRRRRMHLLLDMVVNHVDYDAPMVKSHPGWFHPDRNINDWNDQQQVEQYRVYGLPDLAQEKPEVAQFLVDTARFWIDKVNPIGFRLDAVKHVPLSFWKDYNTKIRDYAGTNFFMIGELFNGDPRQCSYYFNHGQFSSMFDFPLYYVLKRVIAAGQTAEEFGVLFAQDRRYHQGSLLATLLDNHDLDRFLTTVNGDLQRFKLALAFLLAIRGVPTLYYGTEVGLTGSTEHQDTPPQNRGDMRFQPASALTRFVKSLLLTRRNSPALTIGQQIHLAQSPSFYCCARVAPEQAALIIFNNSHLARHLQVPLSVLAGYLPDGAVADSSGQCQGRIAAGKFSAQIPAKSCPVFLFPGKTSSIISGYSITTTRSSPLHR